MFQKYLYQCTDKVIQALNIGTMEMANLKQSHFTPDFILLGLLGQDEMSRGVIQIKNMDSGEQKEYAQSELLTLFN